MRTEAGKLAAVSSSQSTLLSATVPPGEKKKNVTLSKISNYTHSCQCVSVFVGLCVSEEELRKRVIDNGGRNILWASPWL